MEKVIRRFTLNDVIKRKFIPYKNLYEICSVYPSKGNRAPLLDFIKEYKESDSEYGVKPGLRTVIIPLSTLN